MYTRQVKQAPDRYVSNGKPVFGSFGNLPLTLDIRGIKKPFGVLPLPAWITNLRIRSNITVVFKTEEYIGTVSLLDNKMFGFSETILWNLRTGVKYVYRNVMGLRRRLVPKNLVSAVCVTFSKRRAIRISWDRAKKKLSVKLHMRGDSVRPDTAYSFKADMDNAVCFSTSRPAPTMRRLAASAQVFAPTHGTISFAPHRQQPEQTAADGFALYDIRRAYYKLRISSETLTGTGLINGKPAAFRITATSYDAADSDTYSENVLFYDGEATPLPPVRITHPFGLGGKWIIQDTESMVDLSFVPLSDNVRTISIFVLRTQNHTIYGHFHGVLLAKNGESLVLKDFPGIVQKSRMRL